MLPRRALAPQGHWWVGLDVNNSQGVRCGPFVFIAGQVDLNERAEQQNPGDLVAQLRRSMRHVAAVVAEAGADLADLVKLTVFYVSDGGADETAVLAELAACFGAQACPGPAVTLVPVPALAFPGMQIEIEGIAMRGENGERLARAAAFDPECPPLPWPFSHAVRCREMLFSSGITAQDMQGNIRQAGSLAEQSRIVLPRIDRLFRQLGGDLQDAVKTNVFNVEGGTAEDWSAPALIRGAMYDEPGPTATGMAVPRLWPAGVMVRNDVIAMRGRDGRRLARTPVWPTGHWDWPVHLPYRHGLACGDLVFTGGQVAMSPLGDVLHPGDMETQTRIAMTNIAAILDEYGLGFEHVVKINAFYTGSAGTDQLRRNAEIRFAHFTGIPGPASTGVPLPYLAYEGMVIEIDVVAMR
jgi:enamine deaminase RidA (YjgF/YER057c/UK114 family)